MTAKRAVPPCSDELEISVFGPGRGECIVVHVPEAGWFVVDSCRVRDGQSVAAAYLHDLLGVRDLWGFFLTHWHADHTAGASSLVDRFLGRLGLVGLPPGFGERELATLAAFYAGATQTAMAARPVRDLLELLPSLRAAGERGAHIVTLGSFSSLAPATASWSLRALSPSYEEQMRLAATLLAHDPNYSGPRPASFDPNSGCVVLRLEAAGFVVMLTSDLDIGSAPSLGWQAIVRHHAADLPSAVVKIGHHGSRTAHHAPAWQRFAATSAPDGVVTPFPGSRGPLPRPEMIALLKTLTARLFVTSNLKSNRAGTLPAKSNPFTSYVVSNRSFDGMGQVRLRARAGETKMRAETFVTAQAL